MARMFWPVMWCEELMPEVRQTKQERFVYANKYSLLSQEIPCL